MIVTASGNKGRRPGVKGAEIQHHQGVYLLDIAARECHF